jgi:thioredoxin reductase (NADPH)
MMEKVVIIGTGPAGLTAAVYTARANLQPLVIEGMQPGGQLTTTTEVENFPGFPQAVTGPELMDRMHRQAERFGSRFSTYNEVTAVDFSASPFRISVSDGSQVEARTVIVSTGASAIYLGLPSEQQLIGRGVSGCATCDGPLYREKEVAVVGGGDTAMEDALYLASLASKVTLIHRRDAFRASKIMAERVMRHPKIRILWNSVIDQVLDVARAEVTAVRVKNVVTGRMDDVPVDALFVAIGHKPNTEIFKGQLALDDKGFIVADRARTSVPGVFAAGDVQDPYYKQAITAAGSGCMAAMEASRYLESLGV